MARYAAFLGRRVEVHYRTGETLWPAAGTLAADSGKFIFLEERCTQQGQVKTYRWEIPYESITRLEERTMPEPAPSLVSR
jgi:hypothetical protein